MRLVAQKVLTSAILAILSCPVHSFSVRQGVGYARFATTARGDRQSHVSNACCMKERNGLFSSRVVNSTNGNNFASQRLSQLKQFFSRLVQGFQGKSAKVKRTVATFLLALTVLFGCLPENGALAGPCGGRMGGSFKSSRFSAPSSISSPHRSFHPSSHPGLHRPGVYMMPRPSRGLDAVASREAETMLMNDAVSTPALASPTGVRVVDPITYYVSLTGAYGLVVYANQRAKGRKEGVEGSALGSGISVGKISVALDVPDRDDPYCILSRIADIAKTAKTDSRKGVQNIVSEVALELLRQENSISSACSSYSHVSGTGAAERTFYQLSTVERSKVERESMNKFGGSISVDHDGVVGSAELGTTQLSKATSAVVTLLISIEGDRTKIPSITSRKDLKNALLRVAADTQVDDCLLSAEVLWTPERRRDVLSRQEVDASYPELVVL